MTSQTRDRWNLFLCSFTILFVELMCIRWIPAYVRALGFFTNFVLLGSFLGIGLGILHARRRVDLVVFFPVTLAILVGVVTLFKIELSISSPQEVFYGVVVHGSEPFFVLPLVFVAVTLLFTLLGQNLGRLLGAVRPPLTAYTIDIAGSIAGTALFAIISFLGTQPAVWFLIGALAMLSLPQPRGLVRVVNAAILLAIVVWVGALGRNSDWSPYYRIDLQRLPNHTTTLFVNNIGHQVIAPYKMALHSPFYAVPFQTFHFPPSTRELIIGAGSGSDANVAVHKGIRHVTGVELDPTIYRLGRQLNPDHVYQNPAVHIVNTDGRAFLEKTGGEYDLIVFALPDSLALTSSFANLRLESYLFTEEAFAAARRHLSPNGVMVLYNYYRSPWIVHKLAGMLNDVFRQAPYGKIVGAKTSAAILMDGPRLRALPPAVYAAHRVTGEAGVAPATDDWPFLYLKAPGISDVYAQAIALIWLIGAAAIGLSLWSVGRGQQAARSGRASMSAVRSINVALFFTGLAFLLLEAKSIVNFTLLFGATWLVNALVIIGILCTVLIANWINVRTRLRLDLRWLYVGLAATLALNLLVPFHDLLVPNLALRYVLGCLVLFSPILMANLIFGRLFGDTVLPDVAFASNLFGAFIGGSLEYLSLQLGYHQLLLLVVVAYLLSFAAIAFRRGSPAPAMAAVAK